MIEEITNSGNPENIEQAERSLDDAIASIKNIKPTDQEAEVPEQENMEKKRETLRLPNKSEQESSFVETEEPNIQKRINELYRDKKVQEERNLLLQDELKRIVESAEERERYLFDELQKIQNRNSQQDEEVALLTLRKSYQEAIENMDYTKALEINEKIVDFKTEQKLNNILKAKAVEKPSQKKQSFTYSDPRDEVDAIKFQNETDESGNLARPWLQPSHPKFDDVVDMMAAVSNSYIRKGQRPTISLVMSEVDRFMGIGTPKGISNQGQSSHLKHSPVLSSNTTLNASPENQINKLSDLERTYASKLGVSEKDYMRLRKYSGSGPISMDNFKK